MKITIPYNPPNWNEYINAERKNIYMANSIKQKEKKIVAEATKGLKYNGDFPIRIIFYPHFANKRKDLDNCRVKGVLDGLVSNGVIPNDNLNCIQEISLIPIFDKQEILEIEISSI